MGVSKLSTDHQPNGRQLSRLWLPTVFLLWEDLKNFVLKAENA